MSKLRGIASVRRKRGGSAAAVFKPEYCAKAKDLCQRGATTADLATAFGVTRWAIDLWQVTYPEFYEACRLGGDAADARVERALYERAVGYTYTTEKAVLVNGSLEVIQVQHHLPPDPGAAKFWLEWKKEGAQDGQSEDPLMQLARELSGTALRPKEEGLRECKSSPPIDETKPRTEATESDADLDSKAEASRLNR
jgi:hypothetical protein